MLDSDGSLLQAFTAADGAWRLPVGVDEVDPRYLQMLVAYEDKRFDSHWGVDPLALGARAGAVGASSGRIVSGASTLTMQTVRLLEPRPRTLGAKLIEMARALQLEWHYGKHEILDMYLTLAPYGGNLEGVRAASLFYFGKEPTHLDGCRGGAAGRLPQSPERLRPDRNGAAARPQRDNILARMAELGVMTRAGRGRGGGESRCHRAPAGDPPGRPSGGAAACGDAGRRPGDSRLPSTAPAGAARSAGAARCRISSSPAPPSPCWWSRTARGQSAPMSAPADFLDAGRYGQNDMVRAIRSPGSTLKPFIYGMAFDDLIVHPETIVVDQPMRFGDYAPENFDHFYRGELTAREALQLSLNLPAVALLDRIGPLRLPPR